MLDSSHVSHPGPKQDTSLKTIQLATGSEASTSTVPSGHDYVIVERSGATRYNGLSAALAESPVSIGRADGNTLCIVDGSVSRFHCEIRPSDEVWLIRDLGSTNGTYVNDRQVTGEILLRPNDCITVGKNIHLRYLSGTNAALHEGHRRRAEHDPLSGLLNRETFERRLASMMVDERRGALLVVLLEDLKEFNETFGLENGDRLVIAAGKAISELTSSPSVAARLNGASFGLALHASGPQSALAMARTLRDRIRAGLAREHDAASDSVCIGVAMADAGTESDERDLITRAFEHAYEARQSPEQIAGVMSDETLSQMLPLRRIHNGMWSLRRALTQHGSGTLILFALTDVTLSGLTLEGQKEYLQQLFIDAESLDRAAEHGWWPPAQPRYALILTSLEAQLARTLHLDILSRWSSRRVDAKNARRPAPRSADSACIALDALRPHGARALDVALEQIRPAATTKTSWDRLPFVVVANRAFAESAAPGLQREKYLFHTLECTLKLLFAIGASLLRETASPQALRSLAQVVSQFRAGPLSMGAWQELALRTSRIVRQHVSMSSVAATSVGILTEANGSASALSVRLQELVANRNIQMKRSGGEFSEAAGRAEIVVDELLSALSALGAAQLISAERLERDMDGVDTYSLRVHTGPSEAFPLVRQSNLPSLSTDGWCYLLASGTPPLLLAPIVFVKQCSQCTRIEMFLADRPIHDTTRDELRGIGVCSSHEAKIKTPRARLFAEWARLVLEE